MLFRLTERDKRFLFCAPAEGGKAGPTAFSVGSTKPRGDYLAPGFLGEADVRTTALSSLRPLLLVRAIPCVLILTGGGRLGGRGRLVDGSSLGVGGRRSLMNDLALRVLFRSCLLLTRLLFLLGVLLVGLDISLGLLLAEFLFPLGGKALDHQMEHAAPMGNFAHNRIR